jgi:hypothetical protein
MNRRITAALTAAATAGLTACGGITHGTITSKEYRPQSQYIQMEQIYGSRCSSSRKSYSCTTTVTTWIPVTITDPDCWELHLRSGKHTGSVCVSQQDYEAARIGGTW